MGAAQPKVLGTCIRRRFSTQSGSPESPSDRAVERLTVSAGGNVSEYLLRRLVYFVPLLFLVTVVTFSVALLLPGDPALAYIGEANMRDKVMYETMRKELGLDQPIPVQYAKWLCRVVRGDFGRSIRTREPALEGLLARFPAPPQLTALVMGTALP